MDYTTLDGKLLGGEGGEGVLIESVLMKVSTDQKTGEETAFIEIMGQAKTVCKDAWNPSAGWDDLPEVISVKDQVKVTVAEGKNDDNDILFRAINRQFDLKEPLVDGEDEWRRFTKKHPKSVLDEIRGKTAFFKAKKSNTKTGEKLSDYFFNLVAVDKRFETDDAEDRVAAIIAKKKAKKDAANVDFSPTDGETVPF